MVYERELLYMAGSGAAGVLANWAIKNYVPAPVAGTTSGTGFLIGGLPYNLGSTQNMIGLIGGIGTIALGYYAMKTRKFLPDPRMQMAAMAFGGSLLTTTLINTLGVGFGLPPAARAYPRAAVRAVPSGAGYAMMGKRETNIL